MIIFLLISLVFLFHPSSLLANYFTDIEDLDSPQISTSALDFSLQSSSLNFASLTPANPLSQTFLVQKENSIDFVYLPKFNTVSGDIDFCHSLNLTASLNGLDVYSGRLIDFTLSSFQLLTTTSDNWQFVLSLGSTASNLQSKNCQFDFVFDAWQTDGSLSTGFSDQEILSGSVSSGSWINDTTSPTSNIGSSASFSQSSTFLINYQADDNVAVSSVELWYSYDFGPWNLFGTTDVPTSPGSFTFDSPLGDGLYEFYTLAIDSSSNLEDDTNKTLSPYAVQVDTQNPFTNLSLGEFNQGRFALNEQTKNGNFEDTLNPSAYWHMGGDGQHQIVDNTDLSGFSEVKDGNNSALIGWLDSDPPLFGTDYIYQTISVGATKSTLSFWYQVLSEDVVDYDYFEAKIIDIAGTRPSQTIIQTGSDESGPDSWSGDSLWREVTYSLDNWLDSTINLWFGITNNDEIAWPLKTFALIDDVRVTTFDNFITSDKEINLVANDLGSGIDSTFYRLNDNPWQEYLAPFDFLSLGFTGTDPIDLTYYSTDLAGNIGDTKTISLSPDDSQAYFSLVLNIISPRPAGSDSGHTGLPLDGEWLEVYNNSSVSIDLTGFYFEESSGGRLTISSDNTTSTLVASNSALQIFRNGNSDFTLNDTGDTVSFYTPSNQLVDSYAYGPVTQDDKLWCRTPDGTGTWSDPFFSTKPIVFSRLFLNSNLGLYDLFWLYNTNPLPQPDDDQKDSRFQPVDISNWQICHTDPSLPKYNPEDKDNYNPVPSPDVCTKLKADFNPKPNTSSQDKTNLLPQSENLFIVDFDLNKNKDSIFLLDDQDQIVDSYTYDDIQNGIFSQRDLKDTTSWTKNQIVDDLLQYYIYPSFNHPNLSFKIYGMPDNGQYDIEIIYLSDTLEKGIYTSTNFTSTDPDIIEKDFYLGTCSSHGACIPATQPSSPSFQFTLTNNGQTQTYKNQLND